jgi:raffinose/stachyose/melibiose transport system substrate-binding protein
MNLTMPRRSGVTIGALALSAGLLFTACSSGATTAPSEGATAAPTDAPSESMAPESMAPEGATLVVWDQEVRNAIDPVVEQLNEEFEAEHPGVTIERESKSFDDLSSTVKLALADENGPDVAQVNQGRGDMGAAVEAGLLLPLDDYAAEFGWDERWGQSVSSRNSFTEDGKEFGTGNLYGASMTGELVGIFYNKEKLEALDLEPATTFPELMEQFETIKAAGEIPVAFGALDGDALQIYGSILQTEVTSEWLNNWIFGLNDESFATPEAAASGATLTDMATSEYFTPGFEGIGYDDSWKSFAAGDGVYFWTGSWIGGDLVGASGENFGFIRTPPQEAGGGALSIGGVGLPWAIRATSENADIAAEYIDWMTSDRAMELIAAAGVLPSHGNPEGSGDLFNDMKAAFADANEKDEVGHFLDWAAPTMWDTFKAELPKMLAGQTTPEQLTQTIDTEYQSFNYTLR